MQITTVTIHNFRSLNDVQFNLRDYSLLIGANNSGKTNVIDALRVFYDKPKFAATDKPKGMEHDANSWIEIEYMLTDDEYDSLKADYQLKDKRLRVRKNLTGSKKGIFAYKKDGSLADELFYGAKNVQQGKLGEIIYIPAASNLGEHMKTSGPSTLRDIINDIVAKLVKSSKTFQGLVDEFTSRMQTFKTDQTDEEFSLQGLQDDINEQITEWNTEFRINFNPFSEKEIVKNLVSFDFHDHQLSDSLPSSSFGQGFQRHMIYTLLTGLSKYSPLAESSRKKDFTPNLTLILFEEPEAFLHPPQQTALCIALKNLGKSDSVQVLLSTHSPQFVSNSTDDLVALVRLHRESGLTKVWQLSEEVRLQIFEDNQEINDILNIAADDGSRHLDMEAVKYFLWLDPSRCGAFFSAHVLLVEGATEVAFINLLMAEGLIEPPKGGLFVLDCFGKWNIHRFMRLFYEFGVKHSVLFDFDSGQDKHKKVNDLIQNRKNDHTHEVACLEHDLESFLGVDSAKESRQKPQHLMYLYQKGNICDDKLEAFVNELHKLLPNN